MQTLSSEGWSWIKKDGTGSRKSGNRIPFAMGDVVMKVFLQVFPFLVWSGLLCFALFLRRSIASVAFGCVDFPYRPPWCTAFAGVAQIRSGAVSRCQACAF